MVFDFKAWVLRVVGWGKGGGGGDGWGVGKR